MKRKAKQANRLELPVFTVSLDLELMWGTLDRPYSDRFRRICEMERRHVIEKLLDMFAKYGISATWAVVGKLFQDPAKGDDLFCGADLIDKIRRCPVEQEIGSHTLCHTVMGDPAHTESTAEREISECVRLAAETGLKLETFIFPRNRPGHMEVLKRFGFTSYRGEEPHWYARYSRPVQRIGHLLDILTARTPPSVMPLEEDGIWNIPGSMLYTPSFGCRRFVPVWLRVLRARRGLAQALRTNGIFHLWFHPTDVVIRMDAMLRGFDQILANAARLRDKGRLAILPMRALVPAKESGKRNLNYARAVAS